MAEYIERKAALEICETEYQNRLRMLDYSGDTVAWNIGGEIKALPAADVAPVVHGRKIEDGDIGCFWLCSLCGECLPYGANYCPNCGARMDGGEAE